MKNKEIQVRVAYHEESEVITRFQLAMALETENLQLDPATTFRGVEAVFIHPGKGTYYLALAGDKVVGCMLTTLEWSDWRNQTILWIQSVYVMPEFRKKGIFSRLYHHLEQLIANDPAIGGIRLYVDKSNLVARNVYSRLGMNGDHYGVFEKMK